MLANEPKNQRFGDSPADVAGRFARCTSLRAHSNIETCQDLSPDGHRATKLLADIAAAVIASLASTQYHEAGLRQFLTQKFKELPPEQRNLIERNFGPEVGMEVCLKLLLEGHEKISLARKPEEG